MTFTPLLIMPDFTDALAERLDRDAEFRILMSIAVSFLPPRDLVVIILRHGLISNNPYSVPTIARLLHRSPSTVYADLRRAYSLLREHRPRPHQPQPPPVHRHRGRTDTPPPVVII